jgi:hypothetical protein
MTLLNQWQITRISHQRRSGITSFDSWSTGRPRRLRPHSHAGARCPLADNPPLNSSVLTQCAARLALICLTSPTYKHLQTRPVRLSLPSCGTQQRFCAAKRMHRRSFVGKTRNSLQRTLPQTGPMFRGLITTCVAPSRSTRRKMSCPLSTDGAADS